MVCNYWKENKWVKLEDIHPGFSSIQKELPPFSPNNYDDVFLWKSDPKGEFTVSSAYKNTFSQIRNPFWSKVWNNILIPKVNMFFWLASHNSILTIDNLIRRGLKFPNRCELCQKEGESVDHLFFHCSFTREIWCKMWEKWKINWVMKKSIKDIIWQWNYPTKCQIIKNLWSLTLLMICWGIWKERNNRIFREEKCNIQVVFEKICRAIKENINIPRKNNQQWAIINMNDMEKYIITEWNLIHKVYRVDNKKKRDNIAWRFPNYDWIKVNFDGAAKGNPGKAGGGGVTRNAQGRCIVAFASPFGTQNNHVAEAMAMLKSLQLAQEFKFKKVWLEGDSLNIIQVLKGISSVSWNIANIIKNAKTILNNYVSIILTHTFKEGNKVADILANEGVNLEKGVKYIGEDHIKWEIKEQLYFDRLNGASKYYD